MKMDAFTLPHIEDLLDQHGDSRYILTIDLASGFWQIKMHPRSQEKTAFITSHGLFEFWVMPFRLTNALVVFQRLMLMSLNPANGSQSYQSIWMTY